MSPSGAMRRDEPEASLFVIFGGTGDLARRKLLPALAQLAEADSLGPRFHVLGIGSKTDVDDEGYRALASEALRDAGVSERATQKFCTSCLHYQTIGDSSSEHFRALAERIAALEAEHQLPGNRSIYLALPPSIFPKAVRGLGEVGLNRSSGWTRLVVEKPFGHDLASARELNALVHEHFDESQIYRIDHYLGKETVQNLLVLRFANAIFESLWNRERVHSVQIHVAESLGVGTRARYYDHSGALRDMIQNHLTQLLTLVAMEIPSRFEADSIRYEKIKVLRSIAPLDCSRVVRARYTAGEVDGESARGYLEEEGVPADSTTETFVAMAVEVDNWRWKGVPFYLRTGKRLKRRMTEISVRFHDVPVSLFRAANGVPHDTADVLVIRLQPDEGFSLHFDVKTPGHPFELKRIPLAFRYGDVFTDLPDSYRTLLLDVLCGDQTLFVHADEVEQSWRLYAPLLDDPPPLASYRAGTWGPDAADDLAIPDTDLWKHNT